MRSVLLLLAACAVVAAQPRAGELRIYVVDVEGGNATLFVAPWGESVLIDTGNGGAAANRDAGRIEAAVNDAGLSQIDHLITTHWHGDHFGGMAEVAARVPIRHFIDHGPTVQPQPASTEFLDKIYPGLMAKAMHNVVQPGDRVPLTGVDWRIVSSGGKVLKSALPGGGRQNPLCASFKPMEPDTTENAHSVGSVVTFGRFRVSHLGDLTWNKEGELMCPANPIGTVDLAIVSHHGLNVSNSEVLVHALQPRAAIVNNGTRKGGQPSTMQILYTTPRLQDLWQMHFSELSGQEYTVPGVFIANEIDSQPTSMPIAAASQPPAGTPAPAAPVHNGTAYWFKVTARQDGSFTIVNQRNGFTKNYPPQ